MATAQVSSESSVGFPPKGSLRRVPFPKLIREVARAKLDGSLYLLSGQTKKVVFFQRGQPVFVRSNVLSECLGQILAQEGLITQEQCEQTLEAIRRTGKKQGELLVEMGILSEGNLRYGLEAQLRAKLFEIFSWEEGRYQFKKEPPELQFGVTLKSSAEGVIVEAIQDQYTEERAVETLERLDDKYPVLQANALEIAAPTLLVEEQHFLACLDGSRTVRELMDNEPTPAVPSHYSLLCGLLLAGLIELSETAKAAGDRPEAPNLDPGGGSDEDLTPGYEAQALITEYEDTPLPGEMPQSPGLLGDHEDGFEGVGEDSAVMRVVDVVRTTEVPEDLRAAEPARVEETFDDDQIEMVDDLDLDDDDNGPPLLDAAPPAELTPDVPGLDLDDDESFDLGAELGDTAMPPVAVPEPVARGGTEPPLDGAAPAQPEPLPSPPEAPAAVAPPAQVGAAPAAPEPVAPGPAPSGDVASEDALLSLAPDDDLLMLDENVEAQAMDLLGEGDGQGPGLTDDQLANLDLGNDEDLAPLESIDAVPLETIDPTSIEPDSIDDDVLEVSPDDLELAELDDDDIDSLGELSSPEQAPLAAPDAGGDGDDALMDFADLDDIDLGANEEDDGGDDEFDGGGADDDMQGALHFSAGQSAIAEQRWADAVTELERAYETGFDVAELHAMLAYARFQASGGDEQTAQHAFELLEYAQQIDPSLDLVHAYRGAIHRARGDIPQARESLDRALELNPYCELAMEIQDAIG
ncbi:MAG: DUF4388 domain-containing protein [Myxococcota bacterium]